MTVFGRMHSPLSLALPEFTEYEQVTAGSGLETSRQVQGDVHVWNLQC